MPRLRFVLGDVHRQLDELPDRSARALAPGQRHRRGHACQPPPPVRRGRSADRPQCRTLLLRGRRLGAPALGGHEGSLRECHVARHRHGRLDQYGAAPAGRGPRGRGGFHDAGYRPPFAPGARTVQGRPQLALPYPGCQPCGRHPLDPGRTRPRRIARHLGREGRRAHARPGHRGLRPAERNSEQRSQTALPERPGRPLQPGTGHTTDLLRHTGHRPHGRLHPRSGTRLFPRRRAGRTDGQHRPPGLHRQDGRRRRVAVCLPRARPRLRIAGAGHRRHPRRRGAGRRRGRHPL